MVTPLWMVPTCTVPRLPGRRQQWCGRDRAAVQRMVHDKVGMNKVEHKAREKALSTAHDARALQKKDTPDTAVVRNISKQAFERTSCYIKRLL